MIRFRKFLPTLGDPIFVSLFGRFYVWNNAFPNRSADPNWGKIPSDIGINTSVDYQEVERSQKFQTDLMQFLFTKINFANYNVIGEIGGSPFVQSKFLLNNYPHLKALLTDRHEVYWRSISRLNLISNAEFATFDANLDDFEYFKKCDFLWMWGVDLFMDDSRLIKLLDFAKQNGIGILIGSAAVEHLKYSPKKIISRIRFLRTLNQILNNKKQIAEFETSVYRSAHYFSRLGRRAEVSHFDLGAISKYRIHCFNIKD